MATRATRLVGVVALSLLGAPRLAATDDHGMVPLEAIVAGLRPNWVPVRGLYAAGGAGWEVVDQLSFQGELGYATGRSNTGLLGDTNVWHASLAPRVAVLGDRRRADLALLGGFTSFGLGTLGVSAGVDLQLHDARALGPILKGRLGLGPLCLYVVGAAVFGGSDRYALSIGLEMFRVPIPR